MRKKSFAMGKGVFYFKVKTGPTKITIKRKEKKEAVDAYLGYIKIGKDVEWLGRWDGKKFQESETPTEDSAAA